MEALLGATARRRYEIVAGGYVAVMAAIAVTSYTQPVLYRFHDSVLMWLLCILAVVLTVFRHRRTPRRIDWWLPAAVVALALVSYPNSSRDYLRYLFDGEMIRLWHMSPYTHLPGTVPPDQYSRLFRPAFWVAMPSPYGPLSQAMMVGINFVTSNRLVWGIVALKLVNLVGLLACARLLCLLTGRAGVSWLMLINPIVILNTVATPHWEILLLCGVLGAYYIGSSAGKGLLLAGAGLVKANAVMFAPFVAERRRVALTVALTAVAAVILLALLGSLLGFDPVAMLSANQAGGLFAKDSLLVHSLLPGAPAGTVVLGSYSLFAFGYAAVLVAFLAGKITRLRALTLSSWLVPLCLTGLLLPWHFMIPLVFLLMSEGAVEYWVVLFLTLLVSRSAVTVVQLLVTAAALAVGGWVCYLCYLRLGRTPRALALIVRALRA